MSELNRIIEKVSCDTIDMGYMEYFKDNLQSYRNRAEKIAVKEYKQIYINNISLGEEVVNLFSQAKEKYKKSTENDIENYKQYELLCYNKKNQNIEIKKEIRDLKVEIKKEHDYKKKQVLQKALRQRELIISLNTKGNVISIDQCGASLLARYNIYKELAEQVNDSYNPSNSKTNEEKLNKIVELIETIAGTTCLGTVLTIKSITKAVADLVNSYDYSQLEDDRIESINEEYQLQRRKYINFGVVYLALKIYLEDWEFIEEFCNDKEATKDKVVTK